MKFKTNFTCPDCGTRITSARLNKLQREREKIGTLSIHPERCHGKKYEGKHYHISGVASKCYQLSDKGKAAARVIDILAKSKFTQQEFEILHMLTEPLSLELLRKAA